MHDALVTFGIGIVLLVAVLIGRTVLVGRLLKIPARRLDTAVGVMIGGFLLLHALLRIALAVALSTSSYVFLAVVHDWDNLVAQPDAALAGAASAVWSAQGVPGQAATVDESGRFLEAYEQYLGGPWTNDEYQAAWAAGLWVRALNATKDAVAGCGL